MDFYFLARSGPETASASHRKRAKCYFHVNVRSLYKGDLHHMRFLALPLAKLIPRIYVYISHRSVFQSCSVLERVYGRRRVPYNINLLSLFTRHDVFNVSRGSSERSLAADRTLTGCGEIYLLQFHYVI